MNHFKKLISIAITTTFILGCGATLNAAASYNIDETFSDAALKKFVRQYDLNSNGYLDSTEISKAGRTYAGTRALDLTDLEISNLEGLQIFTSCNVLNIDNCSLKKIDLTPLHFEYVVVWDCSKAVSFVCGKAQKEVTIGNCGNLKNTYFNYADNLSGLDFQNCNSLKGTICLDNCSHMQYFHSIKSNIKEIDFNPNAKLENIGLYNTPIKLIEMQGTGLSSLNYLSIKTNGVKTSFTCKGDLARLLWQNELPNHSGYKYNADGKKADEIMVDIDYNFQY